jgi:hypothetical protein
MRSADRDRIGGSYLGLRPLSRLKTETAPRSISPAESRGDYHKEQLEKIKGKSFALRHFQIRKRRRSPASLLYLKSELTKIRQEEAARRITHQPPSGKRDPARRNEAGRLYFL